MRWLAGALAVAAATMAVVAFTSGGDETPAPATTAVPVAGDRGEQVWLAQGCGSCHKLDAAGSTGSMGPPLELTLEGMPAGDVKESIVEPSKAAAAGWTAGVMPEDYGSRISPADLDALVRFLRQSAGD
jgi:mono/diheme cytochrome c family protein